MSRSCNFRLISDLPSTIPWMTHTANRVVQTKLNSCVATLQRVGPHLGTISAGHQNHGHNGTAREFIPFVETMVYPYHPTTANQQMLSLSLLRTASYGYRPPRGVPGEVEIVGLLIQGKANSHPKKHFMITITPFPPGTGRRVTNTQFQLLGPRDSRV